MKTTPIAILLAFVATTFSASIQAQGAATEQLRSSIDQVLEVIRDQTPSSDQKNDKIRSLVNERFDFRQMSMRTVPKAWKSANDEDKQRFSALFADALAKTYMGQIEDNAAGEVQYLSEKIKKEKYAQIDTKVVTSNTEIPVNYRMLLTDGTWRVYDVIIEGVSLVRNYRNAFKSIAKKNGIEGVIAELEANATK